MTPDTGLPYTEPPRSPAAGTPRPPSRPALRSEPGALMLAMTRAAAAAEESLERERDCMLRVLGDVRGLLHPLTLGNAFLLASRDLPPAARALVGYHVQALDEVRRLLDGLVHAAELARATRPVREQPVHAVELVANVVRVHEPIATGRRVRLVMRVEPATLVVDPVLLRDLLDLLLAAMLRAAPASSVHIEGAAEVERYVLALRFEPPASPAPDVAAIATCAARGIAGQLGCVLEASTDGAATVVRFALPTSAAGVAANPPSRSGSGRELDGRTVLLVDRWTASRIANRLFLESLGVRVDAAADPDDARRDADDGHEVVVIAAGTDVDTVRVDASLRAGRPVVIIDPEQVVVHAPHHDSESFPGGGPEALVHALGQAMQRTAARNQFETRLRTPSSSA